jgi:hypothetical protein
VEDIVRELRTVGWVADVRSRLVLSEATPRVLLRPETSVEVLHLELAIAHEIHSGVVSALLNRLRALAPTRQGAIVLPEPELNPPEDNGLLPDYAHQLAEEWTGKLVREYPAMAEYLDVAAIATDLEREFMGLGILTGAARRSSRAAEIVRDAFTSALLVSKTPSEPPISTARELIYAWMPRLAQAGLLMWARRLFGVTGIAIFPVGKFRNPDDPVDSAGNWAPGADFRPIEVEAGNVALQAYALHDPQGEAGMERFIQVLVAEYHSQRAQERSTYVSLLSCRDRVCYRLRIGNPVFERLLGEAVARGAARRIPYSIAVEPDQTWAERGRSALELPVVVNGPRYLLAIEEHQG